MSDLLLDVNLQNLPDNYFEGDWQVASRVLNRNDAGSPLAVATRVLLRPGKVQTESPDGDGKTAGEWDVTRDELLNRPYLSFALPAEQTRALVTRLRRSADGLRSQMFLYFSSGMEMRLERP